MVDLKIDYDELTELHQQLGTVKTQLEGAERFSHIVADMTGDDQLAGIVRDFADKWNIRRGFLIEDLERLAAAAEAIRDTFRELDSEVASGLQQIGTTQAGGGGGGGGR